MVAGVALVEPEDTAAVEVAGVAVVEPEYTAAVEVAGAAVIEEDTVAAEVVEVAALEDAAAAEVVEAVGVDSVILMQAPLVWQLHYSSLLGLQQTFSAVQQQLLLLSSLYR